jgi:hypothetical protein
MYPESRKTDKWLVYPLGCVVFAGIAFFALWKLLGLSAGVSVAVSIPAGTLGFFVFAMVAENWQSGGWDSGGA